MLHNVIPHTPEIHRFCQTQALTLIRSIVYTAKRFAPKPAKVKPPPKPKTTDKIKKQKMAATLAATIAQAEAEVEAQAEAEADELVNAFMQAENIEPTHL
jgi:lysyl-tRNA synthetase class I